MSCVCKKADVILAMKRLEYANIRKMKKYPPIIRVYIDKTSANIKISNQREPEEENTK